MKRLNLIVKTAFLLFPFILFLCVILYSCHSKSTFTENWDSVENDFSIVNDYVQNILENENDSIMLKEMYSKIDMRQRYSLYGVHKYLDKHFDQGYSNVTVSNKGDVIQYTDLERRQYILVFVKNDYKKANDIYKKKKLYDKPYIIEKLDDNWMLVYQHHI